MAVHDGLVERALVPIENSLEGSVNATLDALAMETEDVAIARRGRPPDPPLPDRADRARSCGDRGRRLPPAGHRPVRALHPRAGCPQAQVLAGSSTADAVRMVAEHDGPWAALGTRAAAERYGCRGAARRRRGRARTTRPASSGWPASESAPGGLAGHDRPAGRGRRRSCSGASAPKRPGWLVALPVGVRLARGQPDPDRVASPQAGARALHVLRRPRGARHRAARRRGARPLCAGTSRCCGCSGPIRRAEGAA